MKQMKNKIVVFYIPCKNKKEAEQLSQTAIIQKLAACANFHPITSCYEWNSKLIMESEAALILKTLPSFSKKLNAFILKNHSYECPCILHYNARVNEEFYQWMKASLRKQN